MLLQYFYFYISKSNTVLVTPLQVFEKCYFLNSSYFSDFKSQVIILLLLVCIVMPMHFYANTRHSFVTEYLCIAALILCTVCEREHTCEEVAVFLVARGDVAASLSPYLTLGTFVGANLTQPQ